MALVAWLVWQWIAVLWAPSGGLAVDRASRVTWLVAALWLGLHLLRGRPALLRLAWVWIGLGALTALWVLRDDAVQAWLPHLEHLQPNLPDWRGWLAAGLGNTNHIGDLLALALLPTLILFGETRRPPMVRRLGALAVLLAAALIVCYSVGSNLGLIVGALTMLALVLRGAGGRWFVRRWRRWGALVLAWIGLIAFFNTDQPLNPHRPGILMQGFGSARWHEGGPTRLVIWAQTVEMIRLHPLLGVGTGNFTDVYPEMDSAWARDRPDLKPYRGLWTNAAHNELLQAWAEQGIVGLALLLAVLAAAFHALLKDLALASRPAFLIRVTLAGLLACWIAQAQMNFALQHPTGALSLFAILLGVLAEQDARARTRRSDDAMPPLVNQFGPLELALQWETMRRPTALGVALKLPETRAKALAALVLLAGIGWMFHCTRPVIAQREYRRAMEALTAGDAKAADAHFREGLAIDPDAVDLRSRYSDVLINAWHRPSEGLEQLALVRRRLNSTELYLRESQAFSQLNRPTDAARALAIYRQRVPPAPPSARTGPRSGSLELGRAREAGQGE
jgi:O-antigen ligase